MSQAKTPNRTNLLRQTCNRCRTLKVRCQSQLLSSDQQSADDSAAAGLSCLRCSRAHAICTFGSKQPSGRPRAQKNRQSSSTPSSSSAVSPRPPSVCSVQSHPIESHMSNWMLSPPNNPSPEPWTLHETSSDLTVLLDGTQFTGLSEQDLSPSPVPREPPEAHNELMIPAFIAGCPADTVPDLPKTLESQTGQSEQHDQHENSKGEAVADKTVERMTEIMEVNICIYRLQAQVAAIGTPTPQLCDDLTNLTESLIEAVKQNSNRCHLTHLSASPFDFTLHQGRRGGDICVCRHSNQLSAHQDENSCGVDSTVLLLLLASYQRISNLFRQICVSMHLHIQKNDISSSTTARVVMTTELINHLVNRLDRALYQLAPRPGQSVMPSPPATISTTTWSPPENSFSRASLSHNGLFDCQNIMAESEIDSQKMLSTNSHFFHSIVATAERMVQSQIALQSNIVTLKRSIRVSDKI